MKSMFFKQKKTVYLDYASLAPYDELLFRSSVLPRLCGNPSNFHASAVVAQRYLENARTLVAKEIHALPDEILFTSGGTEGDTMAICGVTEAYKGTELPHIIVSAVEHSAVLETVKYLESKKRISVSYIPVDENGVVDITEVRALLQTNTIIVSCMLVNNELGTIEPIREIAKIIRHWKKVNSIQSQYPLFHVDACQALNYLSIDVRALHVDLLTLNSSKVYAGAGVGALYVKRGTPIEPLLHGGDQERGLRPGTENIRGIHKFALAIVECSRVRDKEMQKYEALRTILINGIESVSKKHNSEILILSDTNLCVPAIVNVSFSDFESELLVIELDAQGIEVSSKSACKSDSGNISHVLTAIGKNISPEIGSIRFSFGRWTKKRDIKKTITALDTIFTKYKKSLFSK